MTPARKPLEHVTVRAAAKLLGISASNMRRYCAEGRVLDPATLRPITKEATVFGDVWMVPLERGTGLPIVTAPASGLRRGAPKFTARPREEE